MSDMEQEIARIAATLTHMQADIAILRTDLVAVLGTFNTRLLEMEGQVWTSANRTPVVEEEGT